MVYGSSNWPPGWSSQVNSNTFALQEFLWQWWLSPFAGMSLLATKAIQERILELKVNSIISCDFKTALLNVSLSCFHLSVQT